MLLLKIRELAPGEKDAGADQALEIDENGEFQFKKLNTIGGKRASVKGKLNEINEEEEKEFSDDSLE